MRKTIFPLCLCICVLLSGCSGVSQEEYSSLVLENEQLRAANSRLEVDTTTEDVPQDQPGEYCMPKEHVKRVAKALSFNDKDTECQNVSLDVAQYNLSAECYVYGNTELKQCKVIVDIKTDNTNDELAAFVTYRIRMGLNSYIEEEINNGCENVVTVINDRTGEPIAVWLAYENNGKFEHDMDVVNTDVLKSVDNVIQNYSKWKLEQNEPILLKDTLSESVESSTTTETSEAQTDMEQYNKEHILSLGCAPYKTEDGSTWYLENDDANTFITYPTNIGYELDDNATLYLLCAFQQ